MNTTTKRSHCLKSPAERRWLDWCRSNGWSQARMAKEARIGRPHLSQMMSGQRTGRQSWKHVLAVLPAEGVSHLRQCPAWNKHAEAAWRDLEAERKFEVIATDFGNVRVMNKARVMEVGR